MDISQYTGQSLLAPRAAANQANAGMSSPAPDAALQDAAASAEPGATGGLFEQLVDTVNPLQHIPGVGTTYRAVTNDAVSPLSAMAGGFLFGGPLGLAAGAAGSFLELVTGKGLAQHAVALFGGGEEAPPADENAPHLMADSTNPGDGAPAVVPAGLSLKQYQEFADAASGIHTGIGATATHVGWADNVWTQYALKQATGQYESSQQLGDSGAKARAQRIA